MFLFTRRLLAQFALIALISEQFLFLNVATANAAELPIVVDGSTSTSIDHAANGVPIVNIAAPNSGGLSHNKFTDYNVNPSGLILNNATGNANGVVVSQIGGLINDNPNLNRSAAVILNEVTSNNISQINGYTEIVGGKADLILANPNGIQMNGAGFINVSKLTTVVGSSNQFNPNPSNLTFSLNNNSGFLPKLTITGAGLDLENITSTDLVAAVMEIAAPIYGANNEVNLRSGDSTFNYLTKSVTSNSSSASNEVAIDASILGKIQAGKIFIIATKEGFGIKYSADLLASRNGITIDAQGNIDYANIAAESGDISVTSQKGSITQSGISQTKNSANDIFLNAFGNIINDGQFLSARNINIITKATFNNQSADLNLSDNDFTIEAVNFINSGQIAASRDLKITATDITNFSSLVAARNLDLIASQITNKDSIYANNKITITAYENLTNEKDIISLGEASDDGVTINTTTLDNNSQIAAKNNITINADFLNNYSSILSLNDINLNVISIENSSANIQAFNNLIIREATSITNSDGTFFAGNFLDFDLGNANYIISGNLESAGKIGIKANNITNQASIQGSGNINIEALNQFTNGVFNGDNSNTKILSGNSIIITSENLLSNYATLSSANNLSLTSTSGNINNNQYAEIIGGSGKLKLSAKNGTVNQNSSHSLVSNGDLTLDVTDFVNDGRVDIAGDFTLNVSGSLTNEADSMIYSGGDLELNVVNNLTNNSGAVIYSEGDLTIQKYALTNPLYDSANNKITQLDNLSGEIISYAGNLTINALTLNNVREIDVTDKIVTPPSDSNPLVSSDRNILNGGDSIIGTSTTAGPWVPGASWCEGNWCSQTRHIYVATITENANSTASKIQAGGNLTLNVGDLYNETSEIYGDSGITLNATKLNNYSVKTLIGRIVSVLGYNFTEIYDSTNAQNYSDRYNYDNYRLPKLDRNNIPTFLSVIKSGGAITGTVTNDISNTSKISGDEEDVINKSSEVVNSIDVEELTTNGTISVNLTRYFAGSDTQGLFQKSTNPNGPLFETRSEFLDQSKFFGSDYFYTRIGLNLTDVQTEFELTSKRLVGDQFFQTKIIEEQLRTISKTSYLLSTSETNVNNEIKSLLDNAADEYSRLGLTTNTALTQSQINSLEKDIIWFETEVIDGSTYIVPKIYLTQTTRDNLKNGSLANKSTIYASGDITLTSTNGSITNDGSIYSKGNIALTASQDILNKNFSNITALNNLTLTSNDGSITNFSQLKSDGALTLTAANDITNSSTILTNASNLLDSGNAAYVTNGMSAGETGNISSTLLETASINGNSVTINAGNDFRNYAAEITSTGDTEITAGNDISIEMLQLRNRAEESGGSSKKSWERITDTTTNLSSEIESGGNLSLISSNATTILGSNLSAVGDINADVGTNLIIANAVDSSYSSFESVKKGSGKISKSVQIDYVETAVASNLTADNINLNVGGNLLIQGSDLNSTNDTNIDSANTIIQNAYLQEYHYAHTSREYHGVAKVGANITSTVIGVLDLAANILLTMVNVATLGIANEFDALDGIKDAKNDLKNNSLYNIKVKTFENVTKTNVASSNLDIGNNLTINADEDVTIQASNINAGTSDTTPDKSDSSIEGKVEINAENLTIASAQETSITTSELKKTRTLQFNNWNEGNIQSDVINSYIYAKSDNFEFNVNNTISTSYDSKSFDSITGTLTNNDSGLTYLTYLNQNKDNVLYNPVTKVQQDWADANKGLTDAGTAVVAVAAITATILTAGAAGVAMAGTTAAASASASTVFVSTVGVAMAGSAASTFSISATNTSMNVDGDAFKQTKDIGKQATKDTTSKESLKNIAIAGVTAAITAGITQGIAALASSGNAATVANGSNTINASGQVVNASQLPTGLDSSFTNLSLNGSTLPYYGPINVNSGLVTFGQRFASALQSSGIQTISSSAAQSLINGDSFSESLRNAMKNVLINAAGETIAAEIATSAKAGNIGQNTHLAALSATGCAMSALSGGDCASGAVSGLIGGIIGDYAYNNPDADKNLTDGITKITAAISSAAIAGSDGGDSVFAGSNIAQTTKNIYSEIGLVLTDKQKAEIDRELLQGNTEKVFKLIEDKGIELSDITKEKIRKFVEKEVGGNKFLASLTTSEKWELVQPKSIGVFFDGTNNNGYRDSFKGEESNVWRLFKLYTPIQGHSIYITGVGSSGEFDDFVGQSTGYGAGNKEQEAMNKFAIAYKDMLDAGHNQPFIITDLIGFSRGASTERNFANLLLTNGVMSGKDSIMPEQIILRLSLPFDTVSSFGAPWNGIDIGKNFSTNIDTYVIHPTAEDERRTNFALQSIKPGTDGTLPSNWIEQSFPGVHSDIGGSYANGFQGKSNDIALYTLNWAVKQTNSLTGQTIFNTPPENQQPSVYLNFVMDTYLQAKTSNDQITAEAAKSILQDKYIHDSVIQYHPAHWSFGDREIYYPNSQLNLESKNQTN